MTAWERTMLTVIFVITLGRLLGDALAYLAQHI